MCRQCLELIVKADDDSFLDSLDLTNAERELLEKLYREGENAIADLLQKQGAELHAAIKELSDELTSDPEELLKVIEQVQSGDLFVQQFEISLIKAFLPLFELAGTSEALAVNEEAKWKTANKAAAKFVQQLENLVPDMNETSRDHLLRSFSAAIEQGKTPAERAVMVREISKEAANGEAGPFSMDRAVRISRTMSTAAANGGKLEGWKQSGVVKKKRWRSANNKRTRPDHRIANGQTVDVDQPFRVGNEKLMFPGDPAGSARQIINCRCTMQSIFDKPEIQFRSEYNDTYKEKLENSYYQIFDETGYVVREHPLNRVQGNLRNGRIKSLDDVIECIKNGKIYQEPDGTYLRYGKGVSVHFTKDTGEIKGIVARNKPVPDWRDDEEDN